MALPAGELPAPSDRAAARLLRRRARRSPVGQRSDTELVLRVRAGDAQAFGELYGRHADAVRAFVLHHGAPLADADDLVAEAFFRVLQAIRNGAGPIEHIRAYLLTVVRRVAAEWAQRRRDVPIDDDELRQRVGAAEESASSVDRQLITRAFSSLPERWRSVLWQVEVEGRRPREAGGRLGLSANATAALARRARDGLRVAYLQAHLRTDGSQSGCQLVVDKLGAYTAGSVRGIQARQIATHLDGCQSCRSLHAELSDVCAGLRAHASAVLPIGIGTGVGIGGHALGGSTAGKLAALSLRTKLAVAAASVTAVGTFGLAVGPLAHSHAGELGFDGKHGDALATYRQPSRPTVLTESLTGSQPYRAPVASSTEHGDHDGQSDHDEHAEGRTATGSASHRGTPPVGALAKPPAGGGTRAGSGATTAQATTTASTETGGDSPGGGGFGPNDGTCTTWYSTSGGASSTEVSCTWVQTPTDESSSPPRPGGPGFTGGPNSPAPTTSSDPSQPSSTQSSTTPSTTEPTLTSDPGDPTSTDTPTG